MKKINESFECNNCKKIINPAKKTCRNHCPYCFSSIHLDKDIPGDRKSKCNWTMYPKEYIIGNGKTKILFVCSKCEKKHWNKSSEDDELSNLDYFINTYRSFIR